MTIEDGLSHGRCLLAGSDVGAANVSALPTVGDSIGKRGTTAKSSWLLEESRREGVFPTLAILRCYFFGEKGGHQAAGEKMRVGKSLPDGTPVTNTSPRHYLNGTSRIRNS